LTTDMPNERPALQVVVQEACLNRLGWLKSTHTLQQKSRQIYPSKSRDL